MSLWICRAIGVCRSKFGVVLKSESGKLGYNQRINFLKFSSLSICSARMKCRRKVMEEKLGFGVVFCGKYLKLSIFVRM